MQLTNGLSAAHRLTTHDNPFGQTRDPTGHTESSGGIQRNKINTRIRVRSFQNLDKSNMLQFEGFQGSQSIWRAS